MNQKQSYFESADYLGVNTNKYAPPPHSLMAAQQQKRKEKPLHSLFAGATAGAIEAFVTYP